MKSEDDDRERPELLETDNNVNENAASPTEDVYKVGEAIPTAIKQGTKKLAGKCIVRAAESETFRQAADEVGDIVSGYGGGAIEALCDGFEAVPGVDLFGGTYTVVKAIYTDCTKTKNKLPGKRTFTAVASVAGGQAAAASAGTAGAYVGGAIGAAFGGVGAVPGAFIGGLVGCIVGSIGGKTAAMAVANRVASSVSEDSGSN